MEGSLQVFKQTLMGYIGMVKVKDRWENRERKIRSEALVYQSSVWDG